MKIYLSKLEENLKERQGLNGDFISKKRKRRKKTTNPIRLMSKRLTLTTNVMRGRLAENQARMGLELSGHEVRRTHKGADFVAQKRDLFGRKVGKPFKVEVKSGGAKLSKAQKREKKKLKRKYKVVRY